MNKKVMLPMPEVILLCAFALLCVLTITLYDEGALWIAFVAYLMGAIMGVVTQIKRGKTE